MSNRPYLLAFLIVLGLLAWLAAIAPRPSVDENAAAQKQVDREEPSGATGASAKEPAVRSQSASEKDPATEARFARLRQEMVASQLAKRDITDKRVLEVMRRVPRHNFVSAERRENAYADRPVPIGHGQTISQPYVVALMTQLVRPEPTDRALDIGTGSGFQAAVLAELCKKVYSVEIVCPLAKEAAARLEELGYKNIDIRCGDGYRGWAEHAPFDVIVVAAAVDHVPRPLVEQLAPGGRMVIPVGDFAQELVLIEKRSNGAVVEKHLGSVLFVPMTGEAEKREK